MPNARLEPVDDPSYGYERHRRLSGSSREVCLGGMHVTDLAITILAALANGYAASLDFVGAQSVKVVAERVQVSQRWMVPLGTLLALGAVGLLAGLAVPTLGTAAAIGLVLYFVCAVSAHLRVRDRQIGGAVFFLLLAAAALTTDLAYRNHW
jgi:DoxX-like family